MSDLFPPTVSEMVSELKRELAMRTVVYPNLIARKRLTQFKADRQIKVMEAIIERLEADPHGE